MVVEWPIGCLSREAFLASPNFFSEPAKRSRLLGSQSISIPVWVDDSHEVSFSCAVAIPCRFWLAQICRSSPVSELPYQKMRVDGRSPFTHCCPGLSVCPEQTSPAKEICLRYCRCCVSAFIGISFYRYLVLTQLLTIQFLLYSLEAAASDNLSQEAIIENLDPVEAERLSRVRNIGIAVR